LRSPNPRRTRIAFLSSQYLAESRRTSWRGQHPRTIRPRRIVTGVLVVPYSSSQPDVNLRPVEKPMMRRFRARRSRK
jgi:hypothetical protein